MQDYCPRHIINNILYYLFLFSVVIIVFGARAQISSKYDTKVLPSARV